MSEIPRTDLSGWRSVLRSLSVRRLAEILCCGLDVKPRGAETTALLIGACLILGKGASAGPPKIVFNRDIRPILSDNCFACHGPDKNKRQAGLRLDLRQEALARQAIVPGQPAKSRLLARIEATQPALKMPPASFHKSLTPAQRALLARWIKEGAEYQAHWAYLVPVRPLIPKVKNAKAARNPIDAFILEKLEAKGIRPSPEADRRTLLRRVSLDLTGLPPSPAEVRAFLADRAPNAYENVVDRLLASPHYGERMATPWLDVVRYADTVGFHGDQNHNAWAYRDYVIDSFNRNKPFDRFTREQLAGDLLPNPTPETRTATCFNRLTMMTREGGAQPKEYLAKYAADRVRTVGMAWLGTTLNCCECHDHKFDPFTAKDFYSMESFFADMKQWGVYADYDYTPNPDLRGYTNDHPFPPEIKVSSPYLLQRIAKLHKKIELVALNSEHALDKTRNGRITGWQWKQESAQFLKQHADGWTTGEPHPLEAGAKLTGEPQANGIGRFETDGTLALDERAGNEIALRIVPDSNWLTALRLEVMPEEGALYRKGAQGATLTLAVSLRHADGSMKSLPLRYADADAREPSYANGFEILGVGNGWRLRKEPSNERVRSVWWLDDPTKLAPGDQVIVKIKGVKPLRRLRLVLSPFAPSVETLEMPRSLFDAVNDPADKFWAAYLENYLRSTAWSPEEFRQVKALEAQIAECRKGITPVMVTEATTPMLTRVLPRGNWQDERGEIVQPAVPAFLSRGVAPAGRRLTRLDLADWLVSPGNPLTSRVVVNRLWKQFFGNGLSDLVDDLGAQGEWPSHPELLDWLAVDFREKGWNIKRIVKMLVMSATYRQSSQSRPDLRAIDPANRLLASQNARRLDAEFVRDNALAVSGLLDPDLGGPPCKPYQPPGYYANIQFPDRDWIDDRDESRFRRGVYMHWQRTFLHPMLANFGAPSREDCVAIRAAANTPQQALTLLNDPEFVEAARGFAVRLLAKTSVSDAVRLNSAFETALSRSIQPKEKQSLLVFLKNVRDAYRQRPEDAKKLLRIGIAPVPEGCDPVELAAWTSVCRVILNLHETITRY